MALPLRRVRRLRAGDSGGVDRPSPPGPRHPAGELHRGGLRHRRGADLDRERQPAADLGLLRGLRQPLVPSRAAGAHHRRGGRGSRRPHPPDAPAGRCARAAHLRGRARARCRGPDRRPLRRRLGRGRSGRGAPRLRLRRRLPGPREGAGGARRPLDRRDLARAGAHAGRWGGPVRGGGRRRPVPGGEGLRARRPRHAVPRQDRAAAGLPRSRTVAGLHPAGAGGARGTGDAGRRPGRRPGEGDRGRGSCEHGRRHDRPPRAIVDPLRRPRCR